MTTLEVRSTGSMLSVCFQSNQDNTKNILFRRFLNSHPFFTLNTWKDASVGSVVTQGTTQLPAEVIELIKEHTLKV